MVESNSLLMSCPGKLGPWVQIPASPKNFPTREILRILYERSRAISEAASTVSSSNNEKAASVVPAAHVKYYVLYSLCPKMAAK